MTHRFAELMFTPKVQDMQRAMGSREAYARLATPEAPANDRIGPAERDFIAARDSFYLATVSETGWPYVQHRGGPAGFLQVIDDRTIGFADYRGNRQFLSVGNLASDDRVALFLMDYVKRRRLKLIGHARCVDAAEAPDRVGAAASGYRAVVERAVLITIEGFDWNCPQHITPRYTAAELEEVLQPMQAEISRLQAENAALRAAAG